MYYDSWSEDERSLVDVHLFPSDAPPGQAPLPVHAARLGSKVAIGQVIARQDARPVEIKPGDFGKRASKQICLLMLDLTYSLDEAPLKKALHRADFATLKELFALVDWLECPPIWSRMMRLLLESVKEAFCESSKHTFVQRVGAAVVPYADRRTHGAVDLANAALKHFDGIGISNTTSAVLSNFQWKETSDVEAVKQAMRFARILASGVKYPDSEIPLGKIVQEHAFNDETDLIQNEKFWQEMYTKWGLSSGSLSHTIVDFCGARWSMKLTRSLAGEDDEDNAGNSYLVHLICSRDSCDRDYPFASNVMVKYEAEITDRNGNVNELAGDVEIPMYVDDVDASYESSVHVGRAYVGAKKLKVRGSLRVRL